MDSIVLLLHTALKTAKEDKQAGAHFSYNGQFSFFPLGLSGERH